MNGFKRLCLFIFGVSGLLSLAALSLVWVGPWTTQARSLITENNWYFIVLEVLVCIAAFGLLVCLLRALFTPSGPKETMVLELDGGNITVTRAAIITQARHVIEADGTCEAVAVRASMGKRGNVRVRVRVRPHLPVDVTERGSILHTELEQGLAKICGDSVRSIKIVFTEPEQGGTLSSYVDSTSDDMQTPVNAGGSGSSLSLRVEGKDVQMNATAEESYPVAPRSAVEESGVDDTSELVSLPSGR